MKLESKASAGKIGSLLLLLRVSLEVEVKMLPALVKVITKEAIVVG